MSPVPGWTKENAKNDHFRNGVCSEMWLRVGQLFFFTFVAWFMSASDHFTKRAALKIPHSKNMFLVHTWYWVDKNKITTSSKHSTETTAKSEREQKNQNEMKWNLKCDTNNNANKIKWIRSICLRSPTFVYLVAVHDNTFFDLKMLCVCCLKCLHSTRAEPTKHELSVNESNSIWTDKLLKSETMRAQVYISCTGEWRF